MGVSTGFDQTSGLFVDQYGPTMGLVDSLAGELDNRTSTSEIFFRQPISNGRVGADGKTGSVPYFVVSGIASFFKWFNNWSIDEGRAKYLTTLKQPDGSRLYPDQYIDFLRHPKWNLSFKFIPEGELAFPGEPVGYVTGPHWQTQLVEAALLNRITAETIWATIASQYYLAASSVTKRAKLFEFGARRNPEWGGLGAARSAYLAGWDGTSNMEAGYVYGIPTTGTMAHSYIMSHKTQEEAFRTWGKHLPNMMMGLPDTYSTPLGIDDLIKVSKELGIDPLGVRLDSGSAEWFSHMAVDKFKDGELRKPIVMYSNSADVATVHDLIHVKDAPIDGFGIGTHYVKQTQDKGISAVMKLVEIIDKDGRRDVMKFADDGTEEPTGDKAGIPGIQKIVRVLAPSHNGEGEHYAGDILTSIGQHAIPLGEKQLGQEVISVSLANPNAVKTFPGHAHYVDPMVDFMIDGKHQFPKFEGLQDEPGILAEGRHRFFAAMDRLDAPHKDTGATKPRAYGVGLELGLDERRRRLMRENTAKVDRERQAARFAPGIA